MNSAAFPALLTTIIFFNVAAIAAYAMNGIGRAREATISYAIP